MKQKPRPRNDKFNEKINALKAKMKNRKERPRASRYPSLKTQDDTTQLPSIVNSKEDRFKDQKIHEII